MTVYSGRTTRIQHKLDDWKDKPIETPLSPFSNEVIFNVQWTDCPVEVEEDVKKLWRHLEYGNDGYYYSWVSKNTIFVEGENGGEDREETFGNLFPILNEYLLANGVTKCLIHWWW